MRVQRRTKELTPGGLIELGPEVSERIVLSEQPGGAVVGAYVLTRAARAAWEAINGQLAQSSGALFWIGGAAGAGKTHFLNYALALAGRAGGLVADAGRHLALAIDVANRFGGAALDRRILELLAQALAGDSHGATLWRQMRGADALAIALDTARRQGVRGVTLAIDLGLDETEPALETFAALAQLARANRALRLLVIAAGRGLAPRTARAFQVAPANGEEPAIAIGRARRLEEAGMRAAELLYRGVDLGGFTPAEIYPFQPAAVAALAALRDRSGGVAELAAMARAAVAFWLERGDANRMILPADLIDAPAIARAVEARLGDAGRAARKIAYGAARAIAGDDLALRMAIDTLALHRLTADGAALGLDELRMRLPQTQGEAPRAGRAPLAESLAALAVGARGVIVYDPVRRAAEFNPRGAGAPEVAAFNAALPLIRRFDSTLTEAREMPELQAKLKRLGDAIASALEGAFRNRDLLAGAVREANAGLTDGQRTAFARFIELAESGAEALIEIGADEARRESALATIAAYEKLAMVAAAAPRLGHMRDYLEATRMHAGLEEDPTRERGLVALETECQLLAIAVNPAVLAGVGRSLDALDARFQKFKWTYVQRYRAEHEKWRIEMERLAPLAGDARRHAEALRRLNAIAALGSPEGAGLATRLPALEARVRQCERDEPLAPETTPCCPRCDFALGAPSPRAELTDLLEQLRRALQAKLATLSRGAIARLIQQHDHNHRLEGLLKIIQAAQTDALVQVLDERLARYLARLLDEEATAARFDTPSPPAGAKRRVVRALAANSLHEGKLSGSSRPAKAPRGNNNH